MLTFLFLGFGGIVDEAARVVIVKEVFCVLKQRMM